MMRVAAGVGVVVFAVFVAVVATLPAQRGAASSATANADVTGRVVAAAQKVLSTLDEAGRAKMQFPIDSDQRTRWSNLPTGAFTRQGLRLGDLTPAQRSAAMALLETAFSAAGYRKVTEIMRADDAFRDSRSGPPGGPPPGRGGGAPRGGRGPVAFGSDEYYLAFVGTPSTTARWIMQFGGHHLAINMTFTGARATLAPSHTGAQPATFTIEGRTIRPLGQESDRAFALLASLNPEQQKQAILPYAVTDLVLGPGQDGRTIQPEGLRASTLSASQQTTLMEIVREWAGIAHDSFAGPRLDEIRSNLPQTYFAWSGPTTPGSAAYFRIQGPTLVIEYAPQRDVDHIHTIYRDPTNDYGAGFARK
jgi:uncharacterized protein DUF3500